MITRVAAMAMAIALAACHVPMSAATPQGPRTRGAGTWGAAGRIEYPPIDLLETVATEPSAAAPDRYPRSPVPLYELAGAVGITDRLDVEAGVQGSMHFIVPVPHGVWAGLRHHVLASKRLDAGLSVRAGYGGFLASWPHAPYEGSTLRLAFGAIAACARLEIPGSIKPGLAVSVQPMRVMPEVPGQVVDDFFALGVSTTLSASYRALTPYVSAGMLTSGNTRGTAPVLTAGLALEI